MATMAINNDIFRWWMVAPPLLGGHHPTIQPTTLTMSLSHHCCCCVTSQYTNGVQRPNPQNHLQMVQPPTHQDLSSVQMSQQGPVLSHHNPTYYGCDHKSGWSSLQKPQGLRFTEYNPINPSLLGIPHGCIRKFIPGGN